MLERLPPQPIPDRLIAEKWQFATLTAIDLLESFSERPIPIRSFPHRLLPANLGLDSQVAIPGVVFYGGRQSMPLARWIEAAQPVSLNYRGDEVENLGGLVMSAGEQERWVMVTFNDAEVTQAARLYEARKQSARGLHFLLVAPDDSGVTYTGLWLLSTS
jgi:RNA-binding protein Tab2/Atab2